MRIHHIIKAIEKDLEGRNIKHPVTEHARNIGATGKIEPYNDDKWGESQKIGYSDGTQVIISQGQIMRIINSDGEKIDFHDNNRLKEDGVRFFYDNEGSLVSEIRYPENGLQYSLEVLIQRDKGAFRKAMNELMTDPDINQENITDADIDKILSKYEENPKYQYLMDMLKEGEDIHWEEHKYDAIRMYTNLVRNNSYENCDSFLTQDSVGRLPADSGIDKGIVQNNVMKMEAGQNNKGISRGKHDFKENRWNIITIREKGNPANKGWQVPEGFYSPHAPFISAPEAKFERRIIDEKNKIIIQTPYQAGMDRHIWG